MVSISNEIHFKRLKEGLQQLLLVSYSWGLELNKSAPDSWTSIIIWRLEGPMMWDAQKKYQIQSQLINKIWTQIKTSLIKRVILLILLLLKHVLMTIFRQLTLLLEGQEEHHKSELATLSSKSMTQFLKSMQTTWFMIKWRSIIIWKRIKLLLSTPL